MARVEKKTKFNMGADYHCGRYGCGRKIEPKETYFTWKPYRSMRQFRCADHYPKRSEVATGLISEVYAAEESALEQIRSAEGVDDIRTAVEEVAQAATDVAEQYREAAEPFGGGGEMAERADELEGWVSELEYFDPDDVDVEEIAEDEPLEDHEGDKEAQEEAIRARVEEKMQEARDEAEELVGGCPL